ncbi:MFS transporter [Rhodobacteraceae bacterium RKSG542]|uniref:MFS transporter n=1 Tax=Pseudovibrio flavus TaxID=2529854 RepID=UPI0012BC4D02|nr:MFS transporter [Pseudovibrio flavus]MTI17953.1 MFS transporter [Pseudovibrio flavus]
MSNYDTLGGARAWTIWTIATLFVIGGFAFSAAYSATSTAIAKDLNLTLAQVGILASVYTWALASVQIFSGAIMDRVGIRILPFVSVCVVVSAFGFANATSFSMLLLANGFMAIGGAFSFIGAGMVGGKWFGWHRFGIMFGLVQAAGAVGSFANQNVIRHAVESYGWSASLNGIAVFILAVSALMFVFIREPKLPGGAQLEWTGISQLVRDVFKALTRVVVRPHLWWNTLHGGMTFGTHLAVSLVWGPIFLTKAGMSTSDAVFTCSFTFIGMLVGCPLWVWVSERIKLNRPLAVYPTIAHACVLAFVIYNPSYASPLVFFLVGLCSASTTMNYPIAGALVPPSLIGAASSHVNTLQFFWTGVLMAAPGLALSGSGIWAMIAGTTGIDAANPSLENFQSAMLLLVFASIVGAIAGFVTKESFPSEANAKDREELDVSPQPVAVPAE